MYARVLTFTGVNDTDAAVDLLRDTALPVVRAQRGYKGMTASADRSAGTLAVLSLWESEADRDASESALGKTREDARGQLAAELTVEMFEQAVVQVSRPPEVGSALMVTRIRIDPGRIDDNLEFFEREIAPQIAASAGFRALRTLINRQTGEGIVGTVWDDRPAMDAATQAAQGRRAEAEKRGVSFGDIGLREVIFIDLP